MSQQTRGRKAHVRAEAVRDGRWARDILRRRRPQAQQPMLVGAPRQHLPAAGHRNAVQPACAAKQSL